MNFHLHFQEKYETQHDFLLVCDVLFVIMNLVNDAILPRRGPIIRAMARRLQEDWAKDAGEGPRILMSLRVDFGPMV